MPGSRVPSVEKILQEVYGDIEEYSRSNKSNMDRSKRSSRRRTDSRYRSGLQKDFKFVFTKSAGKWSKTSSNISLRNGRTIVDSLELRVRGRYGGRGPARPTHMHDVCQHHRSSPLPSYRIAQLARMHAQIAHRACVCGGAPSECSSLPYISIYRCTSSLLLRGNVFYASPFDGIFSSWSD